MPISDNITNGLIVSGRLKTAIRNAPAQYVGRQRQYLGDPSAEFVHQYAKYATNFIKVRVQGLNPDAPYEWETTLIRMADIAPETASTLRKQDDYKNLIFADESIEYVPEGTKIEAMGSIWIVTNPQNISNATGSGVAQRCRSTWNHLDWYGNLLKEPICVEKAILTANESDMQEYALITKGYVNITCQRNEETKKLNTNSRIILGSSAYYITGFGDYAQEFTGDYDSVRLLEFTARYEPLNEEIDDMERHVAGGKTFSWEIRVNGQPKIKAGQKCLLTATSVRCGEYAASTEAHPVNYIWTSLNDEVAIVRPDGLVTAVSGGKCVIRCSLAQNQDIFMDYELMVEPISEEPEIAFLGTTPERLKAYESATLTAAYFDLGEQTEDIVTYTFEGADTMSYRSDISDNSVTITCWQGDTKPLIVTATYGDKSVSAKIKLEGI